MKSTVFLFGEAEKGEFGIPFACRSLFHLLDALGQPREESLGVYYAIQALLYDRDLIFCRVKEEGFSSIDYFKGLKLLQTKYYNHLHAILIPGVGDQEIIEAALQVCSLNKSLLIITEKDLFDYLTR
ncbi:MAG: hypothetical protein FJZ58_08200 [Chlamydiae bacterium]|nr:hypothetical protein [Chlamydiota bacterium]